MTKIKDLGITIRPALMEPFGAMACADNTGTEECPLNETTCGEDEDDDDDDQGGSPKPKKYYAFHPELISQFKQQLDSHLGM